MVAQVTIFGGIYLASISSGKRRIFMSMFVMYGLWWITLAQTRSAYITILFGVTLMIWHRYELKTKLVHVTAVVAAFIAFLCVLTFMYDTVHGVQWRMDKIYDRYVLRDEFAIEDQEAAAASLASLNGRTDAQAVLLRQALKRPFGMGYIAGTREYMASVVDELPSDAFHGAHNAYLEIMSGAGIGAILGFLLLIAGTIKRGWRIRGPAAVLCRVALYTVLLEALVESNLAFPFHQSVVYFWIWVSCLIGLFIREETSSSIGQGVNTVTDVPNRMQPRIASGW
jgi:O-antigen ligase